MRVETISWTTTTTTKKQTLNEGEGVVHPSDEAVTKTITMKGT